MEWSHDVLVSDAERWLRSENWPAVLVEVGAGWTGGESPDVIGYAPRRSDDRYNDQTILIEAKASRSDFFADKAKSFRADPDTGMGSRRYYITPPDLVDRHDLPKGWGLMYAHRAGTAYRKPIVVIPSQRFDQKNTEAELILLARWASAVERITGRTNGRCHRSRWKDRLRSDIESVQDAAKGTK